VIKAAKGETWFSCIVGVVDLDRDLLSYQNHAHPRPFFWERDDALPESLKASPGAPVGSPDFDFTRVLHRPFNAAAKIVFYSDGLFDQRPQDSTCLEKKSIQSQLHSWFQSKSETEHVVSQLMETTRQFFGSTPPDDVTVVIIERT